MRLFERLIPPIANWRKSQDFLVFLTKARTTLFRCALAHQSARTELDPGLSTAMMRNEQSRQRPIVRPRSAARSAELWIIVGR
jgi:hypothetical protein